MAENFSSQDFISVYEELLDLTKQLTDKWDPSTSSEADPGVVILKLLAFCYDKLSYKHDVSVAQGYLGSVSDRQSAFDLLQMLGYIMKEARSATGYVEVSVRNPDNGTFIPRFTHISDQSSSISYFTTSDTDLRFSDKRIAIMEGTIFDIQKEGVDRFSIKDIDESGRFFLQKTGIAQNGVFIGIIETSDGEETYDYDSWKNLEASVIYPRDKYFFVLTSETGENYIQFPENFAELLGASEFVVKASFSKGAAGNIYKGTLVKITESGSNFVVRQTDDITNGRDSESIRKAESNYYATMDTFNTLVTKHDYNAAIRYILSEGKRLFSNSFCKTAFDRQLEIMTRDGDKEFIYHQLDSSSKDNTINALGLMYSADYNSTFKVAQYDSGTASYASLESKINEALSEAKTIGAEVKLSNQGRYLAVTNLIGSVFANISTKTQSQEILEKILLTIQSVYQAANVEFGENLDYSQLTELIKSVDNRIVSVALNMPEYQIYSKYNKVDSQADTLLTEAEKIDVVAKAVVAGKLPLYKYLNRANKASVDAIGKGYLNLGFGASNYEDLNGGEEFNPVISNIQNGSGDILGMANPTLVQGQVLQFNKKLKVADVEYGYGVHYEFVPKVLSSSLIITTEASTTLLAGTVIKTGSTLKLIGDAGEGLNLDSNDRLTSDYTVKEKVQLGKNSVLLANSMIANGSLVNGKSYYHYNIENGVEYELSGNDKLIISLSSGEETILTEGWIKLGGFSIKETLSGYITTVQTISTLKDDSVEISDDFYYFLKLSGRSKLDLTSEQMLQDNEYLVYADKALSEYVVLGSGTYLKADETYTGLKELTNVLEIENVNSADASNFQKLPFTLKSTASETYTFKEGAKIDKSGVTFSDATTPIGLEYQDITGSIKVQTGDDDQNWQEFSYPYRVRLILVLESKEDGSIPVPYPIKVTLKDPSGNEKTVGGVSSTSPPQFIAASTLILSILDSNISSSSTKYLLPEDETAKFATFSSSTISVDSIFSGKHTAITEMSSIEIALNDGLNNATGRFTIPFVYLNGTKKILANVTTTFSEYTNGTIKLYLREGGIGSNEIAITTLNKGIAEFKDSHSETVEIPVSNKDNLHLVIDISGLTTQINERVSIKIDNLSFVSDFSDEVKYVRRDNGEEISSSSPSYYNPAVTDTSLITKIKALDEEGHFNWLCTPLETIENPTSPSSFFNLEHSLNGQVISYIDIDRTRETLRILPVSGVLK